MMTVDEAADVVLLQPDTILRYKDLCGEMLQNPKLLQLVIQLMEDVPKRGLSQTIQMALSMGLALGIEMEKRNA